MAYNVELSESAERELGKLDASQAKRILKFLHQRVAKLDDPRSIGEALHGSRLGEFLEEIPCRRLPAHLQDRRRPLDRSCPSRRSSQGNLSLVSSLKRPSQSVFRNREGVFPKPRTW